MKRPRYFAIIGAMRTGSNLLEQTLAALGDTQCYGEAFNPGFVGGPRKTELAGWSQTDRDADPFGFLDALIAAAGNSIPGFRIFDGHAPEVLAHVLRDPDCARIVLTRDPIESFVSLRIAQQTGRWLQRRPAPVIPVRIQFDPIAFESYRTRLSAHYAEVETTLAETGQTAFRVDYANLQDPETLQAIAAHIGSSGQVPATAPIQRQNPGSLRSKVANYSEMVAAVGRAPDADTPPEAPTMHAPPHVPVSALAIEGPPLLPALALLYRIEQRDHGAQALSLAAFSAQAKAGTLFEGGGRDRARCAVVCHPLRRAHWAFAQDVFGPGWQASPLRDHLRGMSGGPIPTPKAVAERRASWAGALHRTLFQSYLGLIAGAFDGSGLVGMRDIWTPQSDLIARVPVPVELFRLEAFHEFGAWVTDVAGLPAFPPGQLTGLSKTGAQDWPDISEVCAPDIMSTVGALYRRDFDAFGYAEAP